MSSGNSQPQANKEGRLECDRNNASRGDDGDGDAMGSQPGGTRNKYPNSHQLFLGSIPYNVSEHELKVFFEQWGTVVDVRINAKSSSCEIPNFGFVVFDSPASVQMVLQERPIKFNGEHCLNVEEKKSCAS